MAEVEEIARIPHSDEAEASVLASCMLDDNAVWQVRDLRPVDFYAPRHGLIWAAICRLADDFQANLNEVTVAVELQKNGELAAAGGVAYLGQIIADLPTTVHLAHYAQIVRETARYRRLITLGVRLTAEAYSQQSIAHIEEMVLGAFAQERSLGELRTVDAILTEQTDRTEKYLADPRGVRGVSSGLPRLDRDINGYQAGDLIIVAARTSVGKSSFALHQAYHVASHTGPVVYFSLEMPAATLAIDRLAHAVANLDGTQIRSRGWQAAERDRFRESLERVRRMPLYLCDSRGLTTAGIRSAVMRFQAQHGQPSLVVVDQLGLLMDTGDNEVQRLGRMTKSLAALAGHFMTPVLVLHQLNRLPGTRVTKRPELSDLRDSGHVEQDAEIVLLLHRDSYHDPTAPKDELEIIIAKNRRGPTGTLTVRFVRETGQIGEFAHVS